MCETANQQSISSHMVVYMACKIRCRWLTFRQCFVNRALSRNRSLRDAKPARHLFVWFAKHCLAEYCLSFRGDADECEKQFCFVFRICLAIFDSRLWRPYGRVILVLHWWTHHTLSVSIYWMSWGDIIPCLRCRRWVRACPCHSHHNAAGCLSGCRCLTVLLSDGAYSPSLEWHLEWRILTRPLTQFNKEFESQKHIIKITRVSNHSLYAIIVLRSLFHIFQIQYQNCETF